MGIEKTTYVELHDLCLSSNITGFIKSRRMRWEEQVACVVERRGA
jgi:hypothetical protein